LHLALMLADAVTAFALFIGLSMIRFGLDDWERIWASAGIDARLAAFLYGIALVAVLWIQGLYRLRVRWSRRREALDVMFAVLLLAVVVFTALFLFKLPNVSRLFLILLFPSQALLTIASRSLIRIIFLSLRANGRNNRFMLIVGANPAGERFADLLARHMELGLEPIGHLAGPADRASGDDGRTRRPVLGDLDDIETILHSTVVDEVAICLPVADRAMVEPIARLCEDEGRVVRIPLAEPGFTVPRGRTEEFEGIQIVSLVYGPDRTLGMILKRLLDVALAAIALVILTPLFLIVSLVLLVREGRPVFFRQTRVGLHGRPFTIVKYRTMVPDAEERYLEVADSSDTHGPAFKMKDDPRVTGLGRLLRVTSIDELPQLWNVLKGEMSIVGPRPAPPREVDDYDIWHRRRLSMKPGITGLWQIEARFDEEFDHRASLDLAYIDQWSLWLDAKIILRTIPALVANPGH
jgi:exopolysaccharide biosynthesis polyprenyl glycosylphosphotransferase